jgi:ankyrin repeat protein/class 3 adenylate cyclase
MIDMGEIHTLASAGNLKGIKKALNNKKLFLSLDKEQGWSPLHYAANYSKAKIVQIILDAGVNPNIKSKPPEGQKQNDWNLALEENKENKTPIVHPMDVAEGPHRTKILNNLIAKGGKFCVEDLDLHQAVQMQDLDEIECLLEDDSIKINARDKRGWMPIHYAVEIGNIDILKLLVDNKANVNGSTFEPELDQLNPWEIANDNGNEEMLKYLVSKGAMKHSERGQVKYKKPAGQIKVGNDEPEFKGLTYEDTPKKPDTLLGKLFESKSDKIKRLEAAAAKMKEKEDKAAAVRKKIAEEEERKKRQRVIKWPRNEDPFGLKGESLVYDSPCEAHTYFMDIVGYSNKSTAEQKRVTDELISYVKGTEGFKQANRQGKLIILPTGDGMALVFFNSVHAAFKCAVDVGKKTYKHPQIGLRNGVYSGPVVPVKDINNNPNVSGSGINMAQRCMDAGDNDHILISNGVHQYVNQMDIPGLKFEDWGPVIVKHGSTVHMWTAYGPNFGRTEFPTWRGTKKAEFKTDE